MTLAVKVVLVGLILVVAGYNHRYLVPAIQAAGGGAARRLRTTVRMEALALVAVMAASAVLVNLSPPGPDAPAAAPASRSGQAQPADR
jgi:putative copper export protein